MKRVSCSYSLIMLVLCIVALLTPAVKATNVVVAVPQFTVDSQSSVVKAISESLPEIFAKELLSISGISVVERTQLDSILQELALVRYGIVDEDTAPKVGRLLGANYLLLGTLTELKGKIDVSVRAVSVESSRIEAAVHDSCSNIKNISVLFNSLTRKLTSTLAQRTLRGRVVDGLGEPIAEVSIVLPKYSEPVLTGSNGVWERVNSQGSTIAEPIKDGWFFEPATIDLTFPKVNADFVGYPEIITIQDFEKPIQNGRWFSYDAQVGARLTGSRVVKPDGDGRCLKVAIECEDKGALWYNFDLPDPYPTGSYSKLRFKFKGTGNEYGLYVKVYGPEGTMLHEFKDYYKEWTVLTFQLSRFFTDFWDKSIPGKKPPFIRLEFGKNPLIRGDEEFYIDDVELVH